ncbi:MAG: DUF1553 domain-containing protein [Bryobacterales bacterium]|nr:DUF1553 domain-containing protein [Bryobacterales bacterium]
MWILTLLFLVAGAQAAEDLEQLATQSLRKNCLGCHSKSTAMGGLVLESRELALKGGKTGPALKPGDAAVSLLVDLVRKGKMPAGNPLPRAERELFAKWVAAGAPWSSRIEVAERKRAGRDWWSLQPLKTVRGSIDELLQVEMRKKGLVASQPADKRTLIRRATFDLTGLPPAPEEVDAFVNDPRADAYERLVDRLLASPAYGERWGRHWMDVIRFGESHGYEQNHLRANAWPFRDYIIRSFNEDKPFDRMVMEHLAGDQIAPGDPAVEVGTAFLVAGPHDTVGNQAEAAKRQQRADDLDDMVNATASAFLGLTVNCAKCHDHKFDPILQADYYRMAAAFAGVNHAERALATPEERRRREEYVKPIEAELSKVQSALNKMREAVKPRVEAQREAILARYRPPVSPRLTEEKFEAVPARYVRLRIRAVTNNGPAALDEMEVFSNGHNVAVGAKVEASSTRKADDDATAYSEQHLSDGKFDKRWFAANNRPVDVTLDLGRVHVVDRAAWSRDRMGGFQERFEGAMPSDYAVEVSADGVAWKQVATSAGRLPAPAAEREQLLRMAVWNEAERAEWQRLQALERELQKRLAGAPKLNMVFAGKFDAPTDVYLLKRGNVMDRGERIEPAPLSALPHAFDIDPMSSEGTRRLALAKWIVDKRNPLTPRVLANRIWHYHFGRGIAGTPSDFGFNGERPTHPELLDYLAQRLHELNWRMKPLHREIMLSAAYRQSPAHHEENARIDSEARYLWRFPPQRLQAESIRDSILAVSGKLDRRMGGPGYHLYRYTVDNVATYYPLEKFGEDTYRRAVYQTAARSVRSEMLGQYDCPDSSLPEPKRIVTTSPLQALSLLNNSFVLDQAAFFAQRLEREASGTKARVELAFRLAFGRMPEAAEAAAAEALIAKHGLKAFCRALFNANEFIYVM